MSTEFLHGVRIKELAKGVRPIQVPPTAVIALVGTAPIHLVDAANRKVNDQVLVLSDRDASANFGPSLAGYTIPSALDAILEYGTAKVVVVNVFDPTVHKTSVTGELLALGSDGTASLSKSGIISATIKNQAGTTTYTAGTDYDLDPVKGKVTRKTTGTIPAGATLKADFDYGDPSKVTASDIIGTTTVAGLRTGLESLIDIPSRFDFKPRIILAPGFCTVASVTAAMISKADRLKAHAYVDAPIGTTFQQVLEGRGTTGAINFSSGSQRALLAYPHVKAFNVDQGAEVLEPLSQNLAGLAAYVDLTEGYWYSLSNHEMKRVTGVERPLTWAIGDPNCEANLLNSVGIVTVVRGYGTGFRAWGNRSAAWPTDTHPLNFICVRVVSDILHEAVERAMLPYLDKPLNRAILDAVRESVNLFITSLIQRGALMGGECTWDAADNPEDELALGHAKFKLSFMPPVPMEQVNFDSEVDTAWLKTLYLGAAA